jgi:hypothetical protein
MTNEALAAHKIGISGDGKKRVQQHRRHGWETYKAVKVSTGEITELAPRNLWLETILV